MADGSSGDFHFNFFRDLNRSRFIIQPNNDSIQATDGYDFVALFQARQKFAAFLLFFFLRPPQNEIEYNRH